MVVFLRLHYTAAYVVFKFPFSVNCLYRLSVAGETSGSTLSVARGRCIRLCCAVLLAAVTQVYLSACSPDVPVFTGATMGTSYSVVVPRIKRADQTHLKSDIDEVLVAINKSMSTYQNDSAISLFNASKSTDWFDVPQSFAQVLQTALVIAELSDGAFDPTIGPLVNRWGFGSDQSNSLPSSDEVAMLLEQTGFEKLKLDSTASRVKKTSGYLQLDLNSVAKGYAVDQLAAVVEALGYHDYLVEIGGELRASGENANGNPWRIGIEHPVSETTSDNGRKYGIELTTGAVATSGDYRNAFEHDGRRYSHIIDARHGAPVSHALASVTVVAESAMLADAWATALMVLGPDEGMKIAQTHGLACLFIMRDEQQGFLTTRSAAFRLLDSS